MKKLFSILILSSLTYLGACQNSGTNAGTIKETIPVEQFEKKLTESPTAQLLDVRTPEEYNDGHLKNAVNMNFRDDNFKEQVSKLDKTKPVFVYCLSGGRSGNAAKMLQEMNFKEVYNMDGGIMRWEQAGKATEKGAGKPKPAGMSMADLNKAVSVKKYVLVDYNAPWCAPCQKMMPVLEAFTDRRKAKLAMLKINADDNKALMKEKDIAGIPYLELYMDGKLIWKHEGFIEEAQLIAETKL
ncbi:MAG: rhodanese-like domain-containing protein [Bacteroidota bacterium]